MTGTGNEYECEDALKTLLNTNKREKESLNKVYLLTRDGGLKEINGM